MKRIYIKECNGSNQKIDIFANGIYQFSTNWYSRCKDAIQDYKNRIDNSGGNSKSSKITASISK